MKRIWSIVLTLTATGCLSATGATTSTTADTGSSPDVASGGTDAATGGGTGTTVTTTTWLTNAAHTPSAIHTSWQHEPSTTVTLQWTIGAGKLDGYTPKVWFDLQSTAGADGAKMTYDAARTATGKGELYAQFMTDGGTPADGFDPYDTWTVELTGLQPATDYVARVGTWTDFKDGVFVSPDLGEVIHFRTGVAPGADGKFTVVLAGDSREGNAQIMANADRLAQIPADFWVFNGDFTFSSQHDEWVGWFDAMRPILAKTPFMPVQGNHEAFPPMYYSQFALPVMAGLPSGYAEHAWSMDYGNAHFIGLDSMSESTAQDQAQWLEADLKAARANPKTVWILAMMHHPPYSACTNHGSTDYLQKHWVPLFEKYNVDMVFAGHDHDYERSWPWKQNQKVDKGPVYVVAGGFYSPGYTAGSKAWTAVSKDGDKSNYVVLTVEGNKLSYTAYYGDGTKIEDYALTK